MVFMILVQFRDWTPSVYLMSHELRSDRPILIKDEGSKQRSTRLKPHRADPLLEPLLDGVERVDRHGVDHGHLLVVVLVNDDHVEVLQVELHTLKMDQLHLVQGHDERRLDGSGSVE